MAGRHYLEKQGKSSGVPEGELIRTAVISLGLNDVSPFDADKKIIENQFQDAGPSLLRLSLREFVDEVSLDSPTPGGGSVAALCASLSAALSSMVANLSVGKKGYEEVSGEMKELALRSQKLKDILLLAVDEDTRAFNQVMEAFRLPKGSEEQAQQKEASIEKASRQATLVPLGVLEECGPLLELARSAAQKGNKNSLSDAGVAAAAAEAAATGAYYNVMINLPGIKDELFKKEVREKADDLMKKVAQIGAEVRALMEPVLDKT